MFFINLTQLKMIITLPKLDFILLMIHFFYFLCKSYQVCTMDGDKLFNEARELEKRFLQYKQVPIFTFNKVEV